MILDVLKAINRHPLPEGAKRNRTISKSALYKYLASISKTIGEEGSLETAAADATRFCQENPAHADRHYRHFNREMFKALLKFLSDNDFFGPSRQFAQIGAIPDNLYFALRDFSNATKNSQKISDEISGYYTVYRPSLSSKGKYVLSCAHFQTSKATGAISYQELMHFNGSAGWRRQFFHGYLLCKSNYYYMLTRDSSTGYIQNYVISSEYKELDSSGIPRILRMKGTYSGISDSKGGKLFATGIFFSRFDENKEIPEGAVENWDFKNRQKEFGLFSARDVPKDIKPNLFETPI